MAELRQRRHLALLEHLEYGLTDELVLRRSLDHAGALVAHDPGQLKRINRLIGLDQVEGGLHEDEDARAADAGRAVHDGRVDRPLPVESHRFNELDEFVRIFRNAVIGPRQVGHLGHVTNFVVVVDEVFLVVGFRFRISGLSLLPDLVEMSDAEVPEDKIFSRVLLGAGDGQSAELHGVADLGPVVVALDAAALHDRGQHDDQRRLAFPDHVPEVEAGGSQRTLGGDIPAKISKA